MDLQFIPFSSRISPDFWFHFSQLKLEEIKLSLKNREITGQIDFSRTLVLDVDKESFETRNTKFLVHGTLVHTNNLQTFKDSNKESLLDEILGIEYKEAFKNGSALENPEKYLSKFVLYTYVDLKKYEHYYWFAFPSFRLPETLKIKSNLSFDSLSLPSFSSLNHFFVVCKSQEILPLNTVLSNWCLIDYICYKDALRDNYEKVPGWPLRNLLYSLLQVCSLSQIREMKILRVTPSACYLITFEYRDETSSKNNDSSVSLLGWEINEKGRLGPRYVSLKSVMSPQILAESSVDLNLKLMKWRLIPNLDLKFLRETKVLVLGAGTLGCSVSRLCLAWGIRTLTLVDNSKISYSNPVRQSLFEFEDCDHEKEGKYKAAVGAEKLKKIFPGVSTQYSTVTIPMPGHPSSCLQETKKDFEELENYIKNSDVIFLLTDNRESRWLPTVLGAVYGKLVITAALGFDSFLVIRHGLRNSESSSSSSSYPTFDKFLPGHSLGCYFCNDVSGPGDSTRDRTLDQQCTVTRPGVSYTTAGLAVELMISTLQHPLKGNAPASHTSKNGNNLDEGLLGLVPHSIRGSLFDFSLFTPCTPLFDKCTACSPFILQEFKEKNFEFVLSAISESSKYLETLSGLSLLMSDVSCLDEILSLDDDDDNDHDCSEDDKL